MHAAGGLSRAGVGWVPVVARGARAAGARVVGKNPACGAHKAVHFLAPAHSAHLGGRRAAALTHTRSIYLTYLIRTRHRHVHPQPRLQDHTATGESASWPVLPDRKLRSLAAADPADPGLAEECNCCCLSPRLGRRTRRAVAPAQLAGVGWVPGHARGKG